ncbi:MAG: hypothetical protein M3173_00890, partial [Chloroflexota bacterium]|nr:hypothetical protein [Chloroflexota bacterium]
MRPSRSVGVVLALAVTGALLAVATPARAGASTGTLATGVGYSSSIGGMPLATEAPAPVNWYSGYATLSYTESAGTFQAGAQVFSGTFRSYWSGYSPSENVTGGSGSLTVSVYGTDPRGQQLSGSLNGTYTRAGTALTAPASGAITIAGPAGSATATVAVVVTAEINFYPYDSGLLFRPRGADVAATYMETSLPANRPPSAPTRLAPGDGKVFEAKETQVFTV